MNPRDAQKSLATAGLLLTDALIFQDIIASTNRHVTTLSDIRSSSNPKKDLEDTWTYILNEIDYEPVLYIALRILKSLPTSPALNRELKSLADVAYDIASSRVLLRHDLFGRIYHNLLLGKLIKYYATLYTSIPAARLLSKLVITESAVNINEIPLRSHNDLFRVVDFACGSGTLLSAVYKDLDAKFRIENENPDIEALHKYLIEEGIWGFDVLHHAVHLAATVLFLHNPIAVEGSKLTALKLGEGKYLGSINFLESPKISAEMILTGRELRGGGKTIGVSKSKIHSMELPESKFQVCIMNPPFTRSVGGNLLFGSLPKKERKELQRIFSDLLKTKGLSGIGQAGLPGAFVFLGDKYLSDGGELGLVLQRTVLSGVSWKKVREKLLEGYHIQYMITSFQGPNNWNFSENTKQSEILLVARKSSKDGENGYTFFVNLWTKPSSELEAVHLGTQLGNIRDTGKLYDIENSNASPYNLKLNGRKVGEVYSALLNSLNFGVYSFYSQMELNRAALLLRNGSVYVPEMGVVGRIPLVKLSALGLEIGPDRHQVTSIFSPEEYSEKSLYKGFFGYDSGTIHTIHQKPNVTLQPKTSQAENARRLYKNGVGKLLVVERLRLNTFPVQALITREPVLSNVFWPIKASDSVSRALAVWFNSTPGLLSLTSIAEVTEGAWSGIKKESLGEVMVPDFNHKKLGEKAVSSFAKLYQEVKDQELKPLPAEFSEPRIKKLIDDEIMNALGIARKIDFASLYRLLSSEPMITG